MMVGRFVARCQRGHEMIEFTEAEPFEAHMMTAHGARKRAVGGSGRWNGVHHTAAVLRPGQKPHPWKAPAVPKDWQAKLAAVLEKNPCDVYDVQTDYVIPPASLTTGDVFTLGGENYRVLDTDTDRLEIEQADKPDRRRWFTVEEVAAKRDRVRIVKRAA